MWGSWSVNRLAWSLRKVSLPIKTSDLVLDVGSGSSPHPAADVLLERFLDPKHRYNPMVIDRPTVLADACKMPFRDKAFDYVIAFHVLEHVDDPASFLTELQRVSKAGYIETPNALFERLVPYDVHLLEIMNLDGTLLINKKRAAKPDEFFSELDVIKRSPAWNKLFYGNPKLFHVRYFWNDTLKFKVVNPGVSCDWFVNPDTSEHAAETFTTKQNGNGLRGKALVALRQWYKLRKRRRIDINELLVCPDCHGELSISEGVSNCPRCELSYSLTPVPDFNQPVRAKALLESR
jgi:SAM-dependent methyltransferase